MTSFEHLFLTQGIGWAAALGDVAARGTLLLLVAGTLALLLRTRGATVRHRVWALALAGVLSLPVVGLIVPGLALSVPMPDLTARWAQKAPPTVSAGDEADRLARSDAHRPTRVRRPDATRQRDFAFTDVEAGSNRATAGTRGSAPATPVVPGVASLDAERALARLDPEDRETSLSASWPQWVLGVWAIGAAVSLGRLLVGRFMRGRLGRAARPVTDPARLGMFDQIVSELGIRRPVRLLESDQISVPVTWGCWGAVVAVPATSETWSEDRWRVVLLHELTHVRRGDCLSRLVSQLACVVHWFNPLAWFGARSLRLESERACDEEVISAGTLASDYAEHLLDIARACQPREWTASATVGMARRSQLEGRVLAILEPARPPAASRGLRYAASAAVVATILGVAAVQPAAVTGPGHAPQPNAPASVRALPVPSPSPVDAERAARPSRADAVSAYAKAVVAYEAEVAEITGRLSSRDRVDDLAAEIDQVARLTPPQQTLRILISALEERLEAAQEDVERAQLISLLEQAQRISIDGQDLDRGEVDVIVQDVIVQVDVDDSTLDDRVVSAFIDALDDSEAAVRRSVAVALGRHRVERAVGPLAAALSDADAGVREEVARALGRIRSEEAVPSLVGALSDAEPDVAERAAVALGEIRSETAVPGLSAALDHEDDDVREQIVRALGRIRSPAAVDGLIAALDDSDQRVVRYAIRALARIRDDRAVEALADAVRHDDPDVRRAAILALSGSGSASWIDACWDGVDNDGDGLIDGRDSDCQ